MKVLFYSPIHLISGGGCERWHCDITNSLRSLYNIEVSIITANLGPTNWTDEYLKQQLKGVPYRKIKYPVLFGALIPTPFVFIQLLNEFKHADTIHAIQGFIGQDILLLILKMITRKKIILGWHAPIYHNQKIHNIYMRYFTRYLLNFFDGHMTLNEKDKDFLVNKWNINNVHFIPSGIRTERFLKIYRKSHMTLNFLTVGHYRHQKGIDLALEAIAKFNKKYPRNKAVFRFVGSGIYKNMVTDFTLKNKNITDVGFVDYEKILKYYQVSDIYFLPSREEPFGLVLIESWAAGIPVLATKTEGPLDMLLPNRNGWFIDNITSDSMFKSLSMVYEKWLSKRSVFVEMQSVCRLTAKHYSIDLTAKRMRQSFL